MQSASFPSPTWSAAGNPHDEKGYGLFHGLSLFRNLFRCLYGFYVPFETFGKVLCNKLEHCFRCICELIDFIKEIFYMLCRIESVEIDGSKGDMLTSLLKSDSVKKAFLTILLIGVILLVLFTGIAILKSNYQEKQSWAGGKIQVGFP